MTELSSKDSNLELIYNSVTVERI